jgi:hypothetical protein
VTTANVTINNAPSKERTVAAAVKPARGVDLAQVLPVTVVLLALGAALLVACVLYRRGRLPAVERVAAWAEREAGLPAWAALPALVSSLSLLTAGFGFYWDVAVHIDNGRDSSPFGTPAHWPIVIGLCGLAVAGSRAITLDRNADGGAAVHLPGGLQCSLGAVLVLLCGSVSLAGFPLDDIWHNIFGQDVTLWSPTHIQMIGGASLTTLATWVLIEEGRRRAGTVGSGRLVARLMRPSALSMSGAFLIGLSTLQDEFDMGVPQFNALYHPILIALAAGIGLTAARLRIGPGGALKAALVFIVLRGAWSLVIGAGLGLTTPHLPLYLAEALLVELTALLVDPSRQIRFGLVAGALIGTVGVAAEWAYSQVAFTLPWRGVLWPEAYLLAFAAAVAGGVLGAVVGRALLPERAPRERTPRLAVGLAFAALLAVLGIALPIGAGTGYTADVTVTAAGPHTASLLVRLHPAGIADDAAWFNVTSWQGHALVSGTGLQITALRKLGPGVYRTVHPVPVDGDYKSLLRLATSTAQQAVPVYLPEDKAIPAKGVAADPHFTRAFVPDQSILQREAIGGSPTLKHVAYAVLGALALLWIATLSLGLRRLDRSATTRLSPLTLGLVGPARRTTVGAGV